MSEYDMIYY